jgi:hypothetical protein
MGLLGLKYPEARKKASYLPYKAKCQPMKKNQNKRSTRERTIPKVFKFVNKGM